MGKIITGNFQRIDPRKEMFLGHQYEKDGIRSIDKRCDYCGKWICFDVKDPELWGTNVKIGFNGIAEKVHCGSSHCEEYHRRVIVHQQKMVKIYEAKSQAHFMRLKQKGLVA